MIELVAIAGPMVFLAKLICCNTMQEPETSSLRQCARIFFSPHLFQRTFRLRTERGSPFHCPVICDQGDRLQHSLRQWPRPTRPIQWPWPIQSRWRMANAKEVDPQDQAQEPDTEG